MVKRSIRAVVKATPRKSKMVSAAVASQFIGDEPKPVSPNESNYQSYLIKFYNWANVYFDAQELKDHFLTYARNNNYNVGEITSLSAGFFITLGKISYLLNNDREVSGDILDKFDREIFYLLDVIHREEISKIEVEQERTVDKATQDYWELYTKIDALSENDKMTADQMTKLIGDIKPNIKTAKMIQEHYESEKWEEVKISDRKLKTKIQHLSNGISLALKQISAYIINLENTKSANRKPRKPRTRKQKPASKLVEALSYKKEDSSLNITSINPESIIGSKALLVFNTKTRKFGIFISDKETGLSVRGTTLIDFDENKSVCKTLRKPDDLIPKLTGSTLRRAELLLKEIKAVETKLKGRINGDIILCKVFK